MKSKPIKVAMVQRIFPHYRSAIFSKLNDEYNFRLFHSDNKSGIPQITRNYSIKVGKISFKSVTYLALCFQVFKFKPNVIIQEFSVSFINLFLFFLYTKITSCKLILWGHGYDRKKGFFPEQKIADKLREYLIKKCDAVVLYSDEVQAELFDRYKVRKFFVARNSIQSKEKDSIFHELEKEGRLNIKKDMGFHNSINLAFVARLTPNKQVHKLCDIVDRFIVKNQKVMVHVVGDGPCKGDLEKLVEARGLNLHFTFYGALYEEQAVARIIYSSDFLVIPAWLGLSINHSLCYGTPAATLHNEPHPPEIEFAIDGLNSVLDSTCEQLADKMLNIIHDTAIRNAMRKQSRHFFVEKLGVEKMFYGFEQAVAYSLKHTLVENKESN